VYILTIFNEKMWIFSENTQTWILEIDTINLRTKQQYFIFCLIAKYWHFIFIFISWFFFLIKSVETLKINYNLLGYNVQNLIILYILNLCCLLQWIKWIFKKFIEIIYYWFHIQYDEKFFVILKNEIFNVITNILSNDITPVIYCNLKLISNILFFTSEINIWKYI
jgi:hypothetical protein